MHLTRVIVTACYLACNAGVFFERAICSRRRHVETSRREEEMGRVIRPHTNCNGYYFYSPQSSTVIKSKMAATTILRTRTRFRPPKIRLHCRLHVTCFVFVVSSRLYALNTIHKKNDGYDHRQTTLC